MYLFDSLFERRNELSVLQEKQRREKGKRILQHIVVQAKFAGMQTFRIVNCHPSNNILDKVVHFSSVPEKEKSP